MKFELNGKKYKSVAVTMAHPLKCINCAFKYDYCSNAPNDCLIEDIIYVEDGDDNED